LPDGWEPDQAGKDFAVQALGSNRAARDELAKFRDWAAAKSGADAFKANWGRGVAQLGAQGPGVRRRRS